MAQARKYRQWFADDKGVADVSDLPKFREQREEIKSSLKRAGVDILILVILNFIFFSGGYASFLRYDVR